MANKTDAGNGSNGICRVSNVLRSPSPDPKRSPKKRNAIPMMPSLTQRSQQQHGTLAWLWVASVLLWLSSCQRKAPPGDYDMVAVSVTVKPATIHVGDKVVLDHTVRNDGKDTVPGKTYNVDLYVDGNRVSFDHGTFDKGPGQKSDYGMAPGYHHWQPAKPGKYRYRLIVDESNNLPETDETNNVLEGDIEVLP